MQSSRTITPDPENPRPPAEEPPVSARAHIVAVDVAVDAAAAGPASTVAAEEIEGAAADLARVQGGSELGGSELEAAPGDRAVETEDAPEVADRVNGEAADAASLRHPLAQDLLLNPDRWRIWPAVAVLRWLMRGGRGIVRGLVYRSKPALKFPTSELDDVAIESNGAELTLNAPGLAAAGSPLPVADIARIMEDRRRGGGLAQWLDGPGDRFMQAAEAAQNRHNAAFALATGGGIEAVRVVANLVGRSSSLRAVGRGDLSDAMERDPEGAIGLAGMFLGPISASGLGALFEAFTGLSCKVEEFTGAPVTILRSARVGAAMGRILGTSCHLPAAGVDVIVEGGSDAWAREWARCPGHRRALAFLAQSYIGSPNPQARVFLDLAPDNAPPAVLGEDAAFGGLAVLGEAVETVRLPLAG